MTARGETRPKLVAFLGPTASGKTALAEALAERLKAVLINGDAFLVYKGLDVGTAKPANKRNYKLIDILEPSESFTVGAFVLMALQELESAWKEGKNVVLVGGTGLYVRALLEEYKDLSPPADLNVRKGLAEREKSQGIESLYQELSQLNPHIASTIDPKNPARVQRALEKALSTTAKLEFKLPPFGVKKIALNPDSELLRARIADRVLEMMQNGWVQEVRRLKESGVNLSYPAMRAIGYRTIWRVIEGGIGEREAEALIVNETAQYAKRQRTWLRTEPNTLEIKGFGSSEEALRLAAELVI